MDQLENRHGYDVEKTPDELKNSRTDWSRQVDRVQTKTYRSWFPNTVDNKQQREYLAD